MKAVELSTPVLRSFLWILTCDADSARLFAVWYSAHTVTAIIITVPYRARGALSSLQYQALIHPLAQ